MVYIFIDALLALLQLNDCSLRMNTKKNSGDI